MALGVNFSTQLATARRQAQLKGRPLSQQETAGITAGYASIASERAARAKRQELAEKQAAETERSNQARELAETRRIEEIERANQEQERLAEEQRLTQEKIAAATNATQQEAISQQASAQRDQTTGSLVASGAMIGAQYGGGWGAVIGGAVGLVAGAAQNWSYFCNAAHITYPHVITDDDMRWLGKLKKWAQMHRPQWAELYFRTAPSAVGNMSMHDDTAIIDMMADLHLVVELIKTGRMKKAFDLYWNVTFPYLIDYTETSWVEKKIGEMIKEEREEG